MSNRFVMPEPKAIKKLLEMIFGAGVAVDKLPAADPADKFVATFINDNDELVALCGCDTEFVGYSGGALSMIPPGAVNEVVGSGEMTKVLADNFHEVMNICSKLLMSESSEHLRLDKVLPVAESSGPIAQLAGARAAAYSVNIPQYGKGAVHFLVS